MNLTEAAAVLSEIGYLLRKEAKDVYRARAFARAAAELLMERPDLRLLREQGGLETIPGVGSGIARVLGAVRPPRNITCQLWVVASHWRSCGLYCHVIAVVAVRLGII